MASTSERRERLIAELEALSQLRQSSTIFDFTSNDAPPDRYQLVFRGKGYRRTDQLAASGVEIVDQHEVEMRLPYSYPDRAPDVRWLSPIFHPNISTTGYIQWSDVGLEWHPDMTLVVVCEKLWDLARFAYLDLEKTLHYQAERFWEAQGDDGPGRPADQRVLRNRGAVSRSNIVKYSARKAGGAGPVEIRGPAETESEDVLYIGEDTPVPPLTRRSRAAPRREPQGDDGILFIGDD